MLSRAPAFPKISKPPPVLAKLSRNFELVTVPTAALTVQKSVITGNIATTEGGGLRKSGPNPALTLIANVIAGNWAPTGPNTVIVP